MLLWKTEIWRILTFSSEYQHSHSHLVCVRNIWLHSYAVEHLLYISHLCVFLIYTFFYFSPKSFNCFLMLKSFVYTTRVTSYFHVYFFFFFLKNAKFEIHPRIENKYVVYGFFLSFSITFSQNYSAERRPTRLPTALLRNSQK